MMRIKIVEILKFVVAVSIGFTLRVMFENSYTKISQLKPCDGNMDTNTDLGLNNIHEQLRQPHQPSSIKDVIEYRYFNGSVVFDAHLGQIKTAMKQYHKSDIRDIIKQVEPLMNAIPNQRYKMKSLINGFERIDPVRGKEYVMDLEVVPETATQGDQKSRIIRYSLVKPFSYAQMVSQMDVSPNQLNTINMVYVIDGNNVHLVDYILAHHEAHIINLFPVNVIIYICSKSPLNKKIPSDSFLSKHESVSSYKLKVVVNDSCTFKATEQTNVAVNLTGNHSRMVLLDINVNVTHKFLQRCSSVLSEGASNIYVPIPFATFFNKKVGLENDLSEDSGFWDHDNYEVLCIHKNLFIEGGGLNKEEFKSEAYKTFLNKLINMRKQVIRSTDPSVRVSYHQLTCKDQQSLKYSDVAHCMDRKRKTFQSSIEAINSVKLPST